MKKLISILLLITISSCGDSPFLNEDESSTEVTNRQGLNQGELTLSTSDADYIVKPFWRVGPEVLTEGKLLILITDSNGVPVDPEYDLKVMLWMPTMGHGSFPVTVTQSQTGIYEATEVFFTMGGYWDIHFQLLENEKVVNEVKWALDL